MPLLRKGKPIPETVAVSGVEAPYLSKVVAGDKSMAIRGATQNRVVASRSVGLVAAVEAAAQAGLPIIVQDYPAGSGVPITASELIAVVADQPLVVGVKAEAPPTSGLIETLRAAYPRARARRRAGRAVPDRRAPAGASGVMTGFAMPERLVSIVRTYPTDPDAATSNGTQLLPAHAARGVPAVQPGGSQGGLAAARGDRFVLLPPARAQAGRPGARRHPSAP